MKRVKSFFNCINENANSTYTMTDYIVDSNVKLGYKMIYSAPVKLNPTFSKEHNCELVVLEKKGSFMAFAVLPNIFVLLMDGNPQNRRWRGIESQFDSLECNNSYVLGDHYIDVGIRITRYDGIFDEDQGYFDKVITNVGEYSAYQKLIEFLPENRVFYSAQFSYNFKSINLLLLDEILLSKFPSFHKMKEYGFKVGKRARGTKDHEYIRIILPYDEVKYVDQEDYEKIKWHESQSRDEIGVFNYRMDLDKEITFSSAILKDAHQIIRSSVSNIVEYGLANEAGWQDAMDKCLKHFELHKAEFLTQVSFENGDSNRVQNRINDTLKDLWG